MTSDLAILRLQQRLDGAFTALDSKASADSSDDVLDAIVRRIPARSASVAAALQRTLAVTGLKHAATLPERRSACC